jgi:type I restriction enzyme S subunit
MNRKMTLMNDLIEEISMGPFGSDIKVDNFVKEGIPVLNGANISGVALIDNFSNYVTLEKADALKKANAKRGDIVITHRGTLGQIAYIPENSKFNRYIISQSQFKVRLKKELVNPIYFTYYFHTEEGQRRLLSFKNHVGVPALAQATTNFRQLEFPYIPIETQSQIASVLSSLDSKIELNNRINAELEAMAKTIYDYWFVQFDFPDKNGKPYKSFGGKMVWNEELKREVPEGWEVKSLANLLLRYSDKSEKVESKHILSQGKYPVISQDNGSFISGYTNKDNPIEDVPVIVFGDHSCTLRYIDFPFFRGADGTQILCFQDEMMLFMFQAIQDVLHQLPGYGKYERHYKYLKDVSIVIPSMESLKLFKNINKPIFDRISNSRFENEELTSLRDYLLPMLMNGQVRVGNLNDQ